MRYPKRLAQGDKIGVTATSSGFETEIDLVRLESGIRHFKELGYPVIETSNVRKYSKGRSSDGRTRAKEFMDLVKDPEISVIYAASGGDFLVEMLPFLEEKLIRENPTWVQGFSDTTGLTFTITTNLDIATIYGNNFSSFGMDHWHPSLTDNVKLLEGEEIMQHSFDRFQDGYKKRITGLEEFELDAEVCWRNLRPADGERTGAPIPGDMEELPSSEEEILLEGRALGGCLDVLLCLVGTRFDKTVEFIERYKEDGIVWFLESYDLSSEALTRGLWQLKEAGWFQYARGFIFGRPAMFHSEYDTTYEEAVRSVLEELQLPIILDADIGHKPPQLTMINGAILHLHSRNKKGTILFERR